VAENLQVVIAQEVARRHNEGHAATLRDLLTVVSARPEFASEVDSISTLWRFLKRHNFTHELVNKYEFFKSSEAVVKLRCHYIQRMLTNE
jgi:hypothetical protein